MTKYSLESKLSIISDKFQNLEAELYQLDRVWSFLCENYNGNPLQNLNELLDNREDMKRLFDYMRVKK